MPARAKRNAMARPIPDAPPVTTAVFVEKLSMGAT